MTGAAPRLRGEITRVGTRTVLRLSGELVRASAAQARTLLEKCLADQPEAVVVDLAALVLRDASALTLFATAARQAEAWPGASLLLCVPDGPTSELLRSGGFGRLPVFRSTAAALAANADRGLPSLSDVLLPATGAARHARVLAAEVCERWGLPGTALAAQIVAGELVTNAATHARTLMDLRFSRGRRYLLIAVRDGSGLPPRLTRGPATDPGTGRGLLLIDDLAVQWGSFLVAGGKVVWAALPPG